MKVSTLLKQAERLHIKTEALLEAVNEILAGSLCDPYAHFQFSTDGLVAVYGDLASQATVNVEDVDELMEQLKARDI